MPRNIKGDDVYNCIFTVLILLASGYWLYHHQPVIDKHVYWTDCSPAECQRRQGKINYKEVDAVEDKL
jgi:hypothetical protein